MIIIVDNNGNAYPTDALEWVGANVVNLDGGRVLVGGGAVTNMSERTCTAAEERTVEKNITRFVTVQYEATVTVPRTLTRERAATVTKEYTLTVLRRRPTVTVDVTIATRQYMTRQAATGTNFTTRQISVSADLDVTRDVTRQRITATEELTHWQTQQTQWLTKCGVTNVVTA